MTIDDILKDAASAAYSEPPSELHQSIAKQGMEWFVQTVGLKPPKRIVDIGAGTAPCLDALVVLGFPKVLNSGVNAMHAVNLLESDGEVCKAKGYEDWRLEMHDVAKMMRRAYWDAAILRHAAEHSPCPMLLLRNVREILRPGGYLYVEVPAGETCAHHELNKDHYSVLTAGGWYDLIQKCGFKIIDSGHFDFELAIGPDRYFVYAAQRV